MAFRRGDTFYYCDEGTTRHLHIIICGSEEENQSIIAVPLNSVQDWTDKTTMLQVGDHPFIKKPSCVSYNWVRIFPLSLLIQLDEASQKIAPGFRSFDLDVPITEDILNQITEGALISRMTRKIFKQKIQERLGIANPDPPSDPS